MTSHLSDEGTGHGPGRGTQPAGATAAPRETPAAGAPRAGGAAATATATRWAGKSSKPVVPLKVSLGGGQGTAGGGRSHPSTGRSPPGPPVPWLSIALRCNSPHSPAGPNRPSDGLSRSRNSFYCQQWAPVQGPYASGGQGQLSPSGAPSITPRSSLHTGALRLQDMGPGQHHPRDTRHRRAVPWQPGRAAGSRGTPRS